MEEKTLFKLAHDTLTDTGTGSVSSKGGTVTYRITSLKRKLVNGKLVSTSTPSCTFGLTSIINWVTLGEITVGYGYLDVKVNYSENTGPSLRSITLLFIQNETNNEIHFTVTQGSGIYTGYLKMVSNTLPLGSKEGNTAQICVMAYLKGIDGSKKPETPHIGSTPDWCAVFIAPISTAENQYMLTLTALSTNQTGAPRSGTILLTCGDANLDLPVMQNNHNFLG